MQNPLKPLPTERLFGRNRNVKQHELNASVDRLLKEPHVRIRRERLITSALAALILLFYAGLGALAALQIDGSPLHAPCAMRSATLPPSASTETSTPRTEHRQATSWAPRKTARLFDHE